MLALNAGKLQEMGFYARLNAVVGLGMSILSGNEEGFVRSVSIAHQKATADVLVSHTVAFALLSDSRRWLTGTRLIGEIGLGTSRCPERSQCCNADRAGNRTS